MFEMRLREKMGRGKKISENEIIAIYGNKTAFYSFLAPLQIGALLAGANGGILKKIENFAMFLGVAFQIQDDIQEIFSSEKEIGKPLCSDIIEGQPNLLIVKALENKNLGKKLKEYIGNKNINKEDIEEIRNIMKETGSYDYCLRVKENFIKKAEGVLNSEGEFPRAEKQFLINLANYVSQRKN
jgi:geranylgeranyl diphosphate synthase type I